MKKVITLILLLASFICFGQEVIKSPGGLWYAHYEPGIVDPVMNRVLIVCIQGSGEKGSYTAADMRAEVLRVVQKNGFPEDIARGEKLPFHVVAPMATPGRDIADHSLIAKEIGNVALSYDVDYRFIGGLSLGGQTTSGFLFESRNTTELTKNLSSSYRNSAAFDGFFVFCGQIPATPTICAHPSAGVFIVHATGDPAVKINAGYQVKDKANSCPERKQKVYPNYNLRWEGSRMVFTPVAYPEDAINRMFVIVGGSHSTSWVEGYNWNAPAGKAGYEFRQWIEKIAVPKKPLPQPVECRAVLDTLNNTSIFYLPTGRVLKYKIVP